MWRWPGKGGRSLAYEIARSDDERFRSSTSNVTALHLQSRLKVSWLPSKKVIRGEIACVQGTTMVSGKHA